MRLRDFNSRFIRVYAHQGLTGTGEMLDTVGAEYIVNHNIGPALAGREQRLHLKRGATRIKNSGTTDPRRLTLDACLLAAIYRYRLGMTCAAIGALLGVDHSSISVATRKIAAIPAAAPLLAPEKPTLHQMAR